MYKTENFLNKRIWIKRIIFVSILLTVLITVASLTGIADFTLILMMCLFGLILIFLNQIDEVSIDSEKIIIEQKALLPFLRSHTKVYLSSIDSMKIISDQVTNERGWSLFSAYKKNILEVNHMNGQCIRIDGKLHPKGANALKKIIENCLNKEM